MSKEELAMLCMLIDKFFAKYKVEGSLIQQFYSLVWKAGVEMCDNNSKDFFKLCDLAKDGGV